MSYELEEDLFRTYGKIKPKYGFLEGAGYVKRGTDPYTYDYDHDLTNRTHEALIDVIKKHTGIEHVLPASAAGAGILSLEDYYDDELTNSCKVLNMKKC